MRKKIIAIITSAVMLITMIPLTAGAEEQDGLIKYLTDGSELQGNTGYIYIDKTGTVVDCDNVRVLTIPDEVEGIKITSIAEGALSHCDNIAELHINRYIDSIPEKLNKHINNSGNFIMTVDEDNETFFTDGYALFNKKDNSLVYFMFKRKSPYVIPEGIETIRSGAFVNTEGVTIPSIVMPSTMKNIEKGAMEFDAVRIIKYSEGIERIDANLFRHEEWGTWEISIPRSVEYIDIDCISKELSLTIDVYEDSYADKFMKDNSLLFLQEYSGILKLYPDRENQIIDCEDKNVSYGCAPFNLNASAKTRLSYESSNEKIAEVSDDGTVTVKATGDVDIEVSAERTDEYEGKTKIVHISIDGGKYKMQSIECVDELNLLIDAAPVNLNATAETEVSYESGDSSIVDVDANGRVSVKGCGKTWIYVFAGEGNGYAPASKKIMVEVSKRKQDIKNVYDIYDDDNIRAGKSLILKPDAETKVIFSSSDNDLAVVAPDGTVTLKNPGTVYIHMVAIDNDIYAMADKDICLIIRKARLKQSISTSRDSYDLKVGNEKQMYAQAQTDITYTTSDPDIVSVDTAGNIKGLKSGSATITIKAKKTDDYEEASKKIPVSVTKNSQTITGYSSYSKTYGVEFKLTASAKTKLSYSSSNSKIAYVDSYGNVKIKGLGTAYVTIKAASTTKYSSASKKVKITASLKKPTLTCTALTRHRIRLSWTKVPGASGYKIYLYNKSTGKYKCVLTKGSTIKSVTHVGLKKGRLYKYKVRAYRNVNGKKVYSPYSAVKSVRAK